MMLNFFYDSLDTLKKVKKPTTSAVSNLTLIIFVVVIIAALLFALMDGVFAELSEIIYTTLKGVFGTPSLPTIPAVDVPTLDIPAVEAPTVDVQVNPIDAAPTQPTAEIVVDPAGEAATE